MNFIWQTALKDLRRRMKDPIALLMWVAIPGLMLLLFSVVFGSGGESVKPQVHLLVADQDNSFASRLLLGSLGQGPMVDLFKTERIEEEEGLRRIEAGDASALLVIPPSFGEKLLKQEKTKLVLKTNPAQRILPGIAEEVLSVLVDGVFYLQQVLGTPLSEMVDQATIGNSGPSDQSIASFSVTVNQLMTRAETFAFPPVIKLGSEAKRPQEDAGAARAEETEKPSRSIGELFFPGLLFMSILFMGQGLADDLWRERSGGTLARAMTTRHSVTRVVMGKLLAGVVIMSTICALALVAGAFLYDLDWMRMLGSLLWAVFTGFLLLAMLMLIQSYASSQRTGTVLTSLIIFPLMMVGGSFFPFEIMPSFLRTIGRWTPNGWSLTIFKAILAGEAQIPMIGGAVVGLGSVAVCLLLLTARRLRRTGTGS